MFDNNRLLHSYGVARLMKKMAEKLNLDKSEMFMLGLLHDVGYQNGEHENHEIRGGEILQKQGYKYFNEVKYHGDIFAEYNTSELFLLNWCDMHINGKGEIVSFDQRLEDIKSRRGENSKAYKNCVILIEKLKKDERYNKLV